MLMVFPLTLDGAPRRFSSSGSAESLDRLASLALEKPQFPARMSAQIASSGRLSFTAERMQRLSTY
jgi:hypothetical protein